MQKFVNDFARSTPGAIGRYGSLVGPIMRVLEVLNLLNLPYFLICSYYAG